ncbi:MAG: hypothetical protein O7B30_05145 [Thaumarchaeota archaeon]|nr:hypothetical protein [Nitrososphaerota archaeon]
MILKPLFATIAPTTISPSETDRSTADVKKLTGIENDIIATVIQTTRRAPVRGD